ncbi:protoheme IX farnesyltransferase [bacterium]|nr:MAG: protoheme IX farnesyltransferase [bacterium]
MTTPPNAQSTPSEDIADQCTVDVPQPSTFAACVELTKPGITKLVTITALVGLLLSGLHYDLVGWMLWIKLIVGTTIGTMLASGGANALNMWYESDRDALMNRTKIRPIPSKRLSARFVLLFGIGMTVVGTLILWLTCGIIPALVAIVTTASYVLIYTPLKPITITNTLIGAVPGALPTMIGTTAIGSTPVAPMAGFELLIEPIGLMLFTLMFVWQLPHFFAIAWMCKDDYKAGGFRMLPIVDPKGNHTAVTMIVTSAMLIPCGLAPLWIIPDLAGWFTAGASILLGGLLIYLSIKFAITRTDKAARKVFFGSIIHLPVYLIVFVAEASIRTLIA